MSDQCSESGCAEAALVSLGERYVCRAHYLAYCYQRLETISRSVSVRSYTMTHEEAESAGRFLQDCMRTSADIASSRDMPPNLERAQVYDVLLWASELHGRLRRSPRRAAKVPILLRSEMPGRAWEARAETEVISRHGMRLHCKADLRSEDTVTCIRLDNGKRADATVAWTSRADSGDIEAGLEFVREGDFWGLAWDAVPGSRG